VSRIIWNESMLVRLESRRVSVVTIRDGSLSCIKADTYSASSSYTIRTSVVREAGWPENGSACVNPPSTSTFCQAESSSTPSMTGASVTRVAVPMGRSPKVSRSPAGSCASAGDPRIATRRSRTAQIAAVKDRNRTIDMD
jgi:hypothetical protein